MSDIVVRRAEPSDADGVNDIYNPYIRESAATFETEPYTEAARRSWLEKLAEDDRYPVFVAVDTTGTFIGFANAAPFDPRPAYGTSVKVSVFVAPEAHGRGVGVSLYRALFDALDEVDIHRAYGLVVTPNPASEALHKRFGFVSVATLNAVGRKFGRFHDVKWYEKKLS